MVTFCCEIQTGSVTAGRRYMAWLAVQAGSFPPQISLSSTSGSEPAYMPTSEHVSGFQQDAGVDSAAMPPLLLLLLLLLLPPPMPLAAPKPRLLAKEEEEDGDEE